MKKNSVASVGLRKDCLEDEEYFKDFVFFFPKPETFLK